MPDIEKIVVIAAPIGKVWAALTDPKSIGAWMEDDGVEVDLEIGGSYVLFGGETTGAFIRVEAPHHLDYTWRQAGWRQEWPDSVVRWTLSQSGESTQLALVHTQFPNVGERDSHDEGWDIYWLEPMKQWLEAAE